jgi:protein SCO1
MSTVLPSPLRPENVRSNPSLMLQLITALLLGFGVAMLLISTAYLQDLRMLSEVPELVWAFVCGVPSGNAGLLPLFVVIAVVAFIGVALLWLARYIRQRSRAGVAYGAVAFIALMLLGGVLVARSATNAAALAVVTPAPMPNITILQTPRAVQNFALPATTGRTMRLSDFAGRYTLLFFGYTHCPDICPLTLYEMKQVVAALGDDLPLNVLFVSVDGERDTPEALARYISRFDASFVGMSGDAHTLRQMTPDYALSYRLETPDEAGNYSVEHSTPIFVIDPQSRLTAIISFGTATDAIADGLRTLAAGGL